MSCSLVCLRTCSLDRHLILASIITYVHVMQKQAETNMKPCDYSNVKRECYLHLEYLFQLQATDMSTVAVWYGVDVELIVTCSCITTTTSSS